LKSPRAFHSHCCFCGRFHWYRASGYWSASGRDWNFQFSAVEAAYPQGNWVYGLKDDASSAQPQTRASFFDDVRQNYFRLLFPLHVFQNRSWVLSPGRTTIYVLSCWCRTIVTGRNNARHSAQILTAFAKVPRLVQVPDSIPGPRLSKLISIYKQSASGHWKQCSLGQELDEIRAQLPRRSSRWLVLLSQFLIHPRPGRLMRCKRWKSA